MGKFVLVRGLQRVQPRLEEAILVRLEGRKLCLEDLLAGGPLLLQKFLQRVFEVFSQSLCELLSQLVNAAFLVILLPVSKVGREASLDLLHHVRLEVCLHLSLDLLVQDISLMLEFCSVLLSGLQSDLVSNLLSYF